MQWEQEKMSRWSQEKKKTQLKKPSLIGGESNREL